MQVPSIQMNSVHGQIGLEQRRPQMQMDQQNAELSIEQDLSTLKISKRASQLFIDQTEAFADAHLKGPLRSANDFFQKSQTKLLQNIAKTTQQGDQMMRIENGFGKIQRISAANSELTPQREFNIGFLPRSAFRIKFNYDPGELKIEATSSMPEINVRRNAPQISVPKWQTNVYLKQKNNLEMQVVGLNINNLL